MIYWKPWGTVGIRNARDVRMGYLSSWVGMSARRMASVDSGAGWVSFSVLHLNPAPVFGPVDLVAFLNLNGISLGVDRLLLELKRDRRKDGYWCYPALALRLARRGFSPSPHFRRS
jgi:hypothetical protein